MSFGSASTRSSSGSTPAPVSRAGRQEINHHVAVYRYAPLPPKTLTEESFLQSTPGLPPTYTLWSTGGRGETAVDGIFHLREPSEPRSWGHQPLPDRATLRERRL